MKNLPVILAAATIAAVVFLVFSPGLALAQKMGPPDDILKENYKEILRGADANKDGKLSTKECTAISKDKKKAEKDCSYWDANGDGTITEDEYVRQVKKLFK